MSTSLRLRGIRVGLLVLAAACSSEGAGGPTTPQIAATPVDPALVDALRRHADDPFFQSRLPGYLGDQVGAQPIYALARTLSEDLRQPDTAAFRRSAVEMRGALQVYRDQPDRATRDATILRAIEICVRQMLSLLDGNRGAGSAASPRLAEDKG